MTTGTGFRAVPFSRRGASSATKFVYPAQMDAERTGKAPARGPSLATVLAAILAGEGNGAGSLVRTTQTMSGGRL